MYIFVLIPVCKYVIKFVDKYSTKYVWFGFVHLLRTSMLYSYGTVNKYAKKLRYCEQVCYKVTVL